MGTTHHYDGELVLEFDPDKHWYYANGKYVPGVTTILKFSDSPAKQRALEKWRGARFEEFLQRKREAFQTADEVEYKRLIREMLNSPFEAMTKAADIGTLVHDFAERHCKGEAPELPENPTAKGCAKQFLEWFDTCNVKVIETEFRCVSREYGYAGTSDLDAEVHGRRALIDFKNSKATYETYGYQLAAYALARKEEHGIDYASHYVVRFSKTGTQFEVREYPDKERDQEIFLAARNMYRLVVEESKWKRQ